MSKLIHEYSDGNSYAKGSLEQRYFWFKPKNFNDPLDSSMDLLGDFQKEVKELYLHIRPGLSNCLSCRYIVAGKCIWHLSSFMIFLHCLGLMKHTFL